MAAKPGLPTGHDSAPCTDGIGLFLTAFPPGSAESSVLTWMPSPQVMCVLMVCVNVLELLLDETALPRGMEVRAERGLSLHARCVTVGHLCIPLDFRTHTWGWLPSPCSVHWALQFKSSLFCILY